MAPPACKAVSLDDCPIADELVSATAEKMHRRKDDPIIDGIHNRLDTLEDLAADIREIKSWIDTVVKMTKVMEWLVTTGSKVAWACMKITLFFGVLWASLKISTTEFLDAARSLLRGGK